MPRKKRDIRRDLRKLGFRESSGKGDHTVFRHPNLPYNIAVDGRDGADAERYDERNVRRAKQDLGAE
jgi:predicted RNA binding protein YcfA (HicA-like mRNA interferase family)